MYCHLCRVNGSPSHDSSSGHRAAKELAAVAADRLSDHTSASIEDHPNCGFVNLDDFVKIKDPKPPAENKTNKKTEVFFCDTCNLTVAVSDLQMHRRQKKHTLAMFNEQTLEELVGQYMDKEHLRLIVEPMPDPQVAIDESEAVKTYTCHLCGLDVPVAFKDLHEEGARHRASRTLAVAASKRTRDALRSGDQSKDKSADIPEDKSKDTSEDKSKDTSEDKPKGGSGDRSKDKAKFTGKMMKKLLKLYTGKGIDEDGVEDTDGETEDPKKSKIKRLSTKQYFTDILPYLSYVAKFHALIVDDTEYVTIQIGRDTLKIHVNNYNGINHYEENGTYYMNCHLCDGYNTNVVYSSMGQQDKSHVMSLGHIKNLLAPIENVHMIRRIDETHSVCSLCNMCMPPHLAEHHILKDPTHTAALAEALERGEAYKDSKKHLKIMIFKPHSSRSQYKWNFGIPQAQLKQNSGVLFGSPQCNNFGSAQIQSLNSAYNDMQNNFGAIKKPALFGGAQNNVASFGCAQNNAAAFGSAQNNTASFGCNQNSAFGNAQNTVFGSKNNGASGPKTLNVRFGGKDNAFDTTPKLVHFATKVDSGFATQNTIFGNKTSIATNPGQTKENTTAANDKNKNTCAQEFRFFNSSIETETNTNHTKDNAAKPKSPTSGEKKLKTLSIISNNDEEKSTASSPENKNGDDQCEANNDTGSTQVKHDIQKSQKTKPSYCLRHISSSSSDSE